VDNVVVLTLKAFFNGRGKPSNQAICVKLTAEGHVLEVGALQHHSVQEACDDIIVDG
jgi:hypothetical protein